MMFRYLLAVVLLILLSLFLSVIVVAETPAPAPEADVPAEPGDVVHYHPGAILAVDDAHAVGVLGPGGRGTFDHAGLFDSAVNSRLPESDVAPDPPTSRQPDSLRRDRRATSRRRDLGAQAFKRE